MVSFFIIRVVEKPFQGDFIVRTSQFISVRSIFQAIYSATVYPALMLIGILAAGPAVAAPTEMTALVVVTSGASKDFVSSAATSAYIEAQLKGLNATLRTYSNATVRVTGTMAVASDPTMIKSSALIDDRIRRSSRNFATVLARRNAVKADVILVFAGRADVADVCSWAFGRAYDSFQVGRTITPATMLPVADRAIVILSTAPRCKNLNGIHRGFGKMMGLLHAKSEYVSRFFAAVPDKTVFAFVLDPDSSLDGTTDAMAPETCAGVCGVVYYSGANVSAKVGPLGQIVFYKDAKGGVHDATGWIRRGAAVVAAFR